MASNYSNVFSPIRINGVDFKNRIILAPPSPNLASHESLVTHQFVDWFRMFARGGASILYVGNSSIDITECKDEECQLDLSQDRCVLPLSWYAEMATQFDCHASLEVNHNGKDTTFEAVGHVPFSSSAIPGHSELARAAAAGREPYMPIEMDQAKIDETVMKYAMACKRMQRSGMDIALLHGGHGNLISQFTSPHYNKRTDKYGGSLQKRARFAIEVVEKVRELCGPNFVIDYRISADEICDDGMHFDETLELMGILLNHGVDMFNVSAGLHSEFSFKYIRNWLQNYMMDRGYNAHFARKVKDKYPDALITTVGSITNLDMAEEIISTGGADFVAMCRPLMADPDMPKKYAMNKPEERRPCLRCDACAGRLGGPRVINCAVNPMSGMTSELRDGVVPKAQEKKKVAVIGGGPAGLQAMFTLIDRGHDVTLYEKSGQVGGNVIGAAAPPFKVDAKDYLTWLQYQAQKVQKSGAAKILLNTAATKEMLELEGYDAIILAVGSDPICPQSITGINKPHVQWAPDAEVMPGKKKVGNKIVVVGAGSVGLEAALDFAGEGKDVTVVELADPGTAMMNLYKGAGSGGGDILNKLKDKDATLLYNTGLQEVLDDKIIVKNVETGETSEIVADTVLLAMGMRPRFELVEELRHCCAETEVFIVGDAKSVGNISTAVNPAFQAALHI